MDEIQIVVSAVDNFSSVLGNFGNIMTGLKSTIDLVTGAISNTVDFVGQFVDAASQSEQAVTKLNVVLASSGASSQFTSQQMQDLALSMMNMSGFSDEAEVSAEAMLLRFENLNDIFPQALQLTNDLAVAMGIDLTSAAQTIGKALDDPASGIGRLNMQFKLFNQTEMDNIKTMAEHGNVADAQSLIIERLTQKVGGAAEAYGNTFAGSVNIATEKLDNLKELIGTPILDALSTLIGKLNETGGIFDQLTGVIEASLSQYDSAGFAGVIDTFVKGIINLMTSAVARWIVSGEPEQLSNDIISWLNNVGTTDRARTMTEIAMQNLVNALGIAIDKIDWSSIGVLMDIKVGKVISSIDWTSAGASFGMAVEKFVTTGWGEGLDNSKSNTQTALTNAVSDWLRGVVGDVYFQHSASEIGKSIALLMWADLKQQFIDLSQNIRDIMTNIGHSIVDGIVNGLNTFEIVTATWIDEHITQPFKRFLGIASPSTVFKSIGMDIVLGLISGIETMASTLLDMIIALVKSLIVPFQPLLDLLGIDLSGILGTASTGGTTGTHVTGTGTTSTGVLSGQTINNYFYGPVYFGDMTQLGYDCPSPHPLLVASQGSLLVSPSIG